MREIENLNSLVKDISIRLQFLFDKVPLVYIQKKLSLLQHFKLKKLIESERVEKRVQYLNEFIKKFSECETDSETVFEIVSE